MEYNIIQFDRNSLLNIIDMMDFYKVVGLYDDICYGNINVTSIHMNPEDCVMVREIIIKNALSKSKKKKLYKEKYIVCGVYLDWANYSPTCYSDFDKNIPSGEIWIVYRPENDC